MCVMSHAEPMISAISGSKRRTRPGTEGRWAVNNIKGRNENSMEYETHTQKRELLCWSETAIKRCTIVYCQSCKIDQI